MGMVQGTVKVADRLAEELQPGEDGDVAYDMCGVQSLLPCTDA